jgi:hypothetical protein
VRNHAIPRWEWRAVPPDSAEVIATATPASPSNQQLRQISGPMSAIEGVLAGATWLPTARYASATALRPASSARSKGLPRETVDYFLAPFRQPMAV